MTKQNNSEHRINLQKYYKEVRICKLCKEKYGDDFKYTKLLCPKCDYSNTIGWRWNND